MRSTKLAVTIVLAALGLLLGVRFTTRRAPPRLPPSVHAARDAGRAIGETSVPGAGHADTDAGAPAGLDASATSGDATPAANIAPRHRALESRRRDELAAQIYRDLLQHGRRVASVRATDSGGGVRDNLRVVRGDMQRRLQPRGRADVPAGAGGIHPRRVRAVEHAEHLPDRHSH